MSRHFPDREPHDLERDLRDGPEPPPDLVQRIVSRTRRSRSAVPRGRAIAAAALSTGVLFALGATGGLGSVSSAIKDTAGGVTKVINGSDHHRGTVGSDKGKPAKPARDQYTHPGDGCDVKRGDSLAISNTVKKHATTKKVRKHAPKKHHPPKKKKKPVRKPPVVIPGVVGTPGPVTTTPGPVTTAPDKKDPPKKAKPSPPKGKPRPCPVPTNKK